MDCLNYDLHIHSCLSPCADDDMTPANIVAMAALKGLDVISITDHNSCKNCPAAMKLAEQYGVLFIPGMELTTEEEVHVVCLFAKLADAMEFDEYVYEHLIPVANNVDIFGKQQVYDENDNIVGTIPNLLINATDIAFESVYDLVEKYHGIMIPAHIDKSSNSLLSNLGFVPPESRFTCVEIKYMDHLHEIQEKNPYICQCNVISNSDAHYLEHINEPIYTLCVKGRNTEEVLWQLIKQCK